MIPGEAAHADPIFGNAKLLAHTREVATFEALHQCGDGRGVQGRHGRRRSRLDHHVRRRHRTRRRRHTDVDPRPHDGNHSLVVNTPDGVWVSSENGVSADNWQPKLSKIPGVKAYSKRYGREVVPNANALEDPLDQYDSMIKETILADPCKADPRWLQIQPSSELMTWKRFWPVVPGITHGGLNYGQLSRRSR